MGLHLILILLIVLEASDAFVQAPNRLASPVLERLVTFSLAYLEFFNYMRQILKRPTPQYPLKALPSFDLLVGNSVEGQHHTYTNWFFYLIPPNTFLKRFDLFPNHLKQQSMEL